MTEQTLPLITFYKGWQTYQQSLLETIAWHVLEHEIHHGGELSLALGGLGLPGVYGNA